MISLRVMMTSGDFENSAAVSEMQNNDEDPFDTMIKKTGCVDFHFKVQVEILGQLKFGGPTH